MSSLASARSHNELCAPEPSHPDPLPAQEGRNTDDDISATLNAIRQHPLPSSKPIRLANADALAVERHIIGLTQLPDRPQHGEEASVEIRISGEAGHEDLMAMPPSDDRPDLQDYAVIAAALDEQKMPIPSIWRETETPPSVNARFGIELKAAALGFAGGLVFVVPVALWLSSGLAFKTATDVPVAPQTAPAAVATSDSPERTATEPGRDGAIALSAIASEGKARHHGPSSVQTAPDEKTTSVTAIDRSVARASPVVTASAVSPAAQVRTTPPPVTVAQPTTETDIELHLGIARRLIASSDVARAREVLSDERIANNPRVVFALAETYDPNILAAWGTRGVDAEPRRARALYREALGGGVSQAARRLEALQ